MVENTFLELNEISGVVMQLASVEHWSEACMK